MKLSYTDEQEHRVAFARKSHCRECGSAHFTIHHILPPLEEYYVSCAYCEYETPVCPSRATALKAWKR